MDIACAGRKINKEIIQFSPISIFNKLLNSIGSESSAPYNSISRVHEETDTKHLDAILLNRFDEIATVNGNRNRSAIFGMEHLRHAWTMDIGIE